MARLATVDIHGRPYVPVNNRVEEFWRRHPSGRISTQIIELTEERCVIRAEVYRDAADVNPAATGLAEERQAASRINSTSYVENCETSAVGRALGMLGIGITEAIASAEEVEHAIARQDDRRGRYLARVLELQQKAIAVGVDPGDEVPERMDTEALEAYGRRLSARIKEATDGSN